MIRSAQMRAALAALKADHRFLAVRPVDAIEPEAPAVLIGDVSGGGHDARGFMLALDTAAEFWPQCQQWDIIAGDECLGQQDPAWPARMFRIRGPRPLAQFTTAPEQQLDGSPI
jgi:hypothetical protein